MAKKPKPPAAPRARQGRLPGAEHVRIGEIDDICEGIGDASDRRDEAVRDIASLKASGIKALHKHNRITHKHQGVAISIVPGDEKLSVRRTKQGGETAQPKAPASSQAELTEDVDTDGPTH
jgi:hypothetical protein